MLRHRYLVTYDIGHPYRLRAVHSVMKAYGDPLQYSVFLCDLSEAERIRLADELANILNTAVDSVIIVDLGAQDLRRFRFLGLRCVRLPECGPTVI